MSLTLKEKKEAVKKLFEEMTSSQSLGERCADEMEVEEEDLYDIQVFVLELLDKAK